MLRTVAVFCTEVSSNVCVWPETGTKRRHKASIFLIFEMEMKTKGCVVSIAEVFSRGLVLGCSDWLAWRIWLSHIIKMSQNWAIFMHTHTHTDTQKSQFPRCTPFCHLKITLCHVTNKQNKIQVFISVQVFMLVTWLHTLLRAGHHHHLRGDVAALRWLQGAKQERSKGRFGDFDFKNVLRS